ncbi:MAG: hypothetical protein OEX97_00310 [Acidimicrobiia bacterium]|nr:hypothetical protein [Acidimicrobiia bacterium]
MTLDQRLRPAVDEMHEFGSTLRVPVLEPDRRTLAPRRRGWALAMAAAAALVIIIGLTALLAPFGGEEAPFVDETTPAPAPTTAPSPSPEQSVPAEPEVETATTAVIAAPEPVINWATVDWERISDTNGDLGTTGTQHIESVIAFDSRFVAVGTDCAGPCDPTPEDGWDAAVWISEDGTDWSRVPHDEAVFGGPGSQDIIDVVEAGPGLVAVGIVDQAYFGFRRSQQEFRPGEFSGTYGFDQEYPRDDLDAAVWTSADGLTWNRVADPGGVFSGPGDGSSPDAGDQAMEAVTVGYGLIVAVGSAHSDAAVWVSMDGIEWQRIAHDEDVFGGPSSKWMHDVVFTGDRFVAVGTDLNRAETGEGIMRGAVWVSEDGYEWTRLPSDPSVFGGLIEQSDDLAENEPYFVWTVTTTETGLIAAGTSPKRMALWTSDDGLTWARIWDETAPFSRAQVKLFPNGADLRHDPVKALLETESGIVAVGWDRDTASVVYINSEWHFEHDLVLGQLEVEIAMTDVIDAGGGSLLAVGYSGGDAAVWIGNISN